MFTIHLAQRIGIGSAIGSHLRAAAPSKFKDFLDTTVTGARCPIPNQRGTSLGQNGEGKLLCPRKARLSASPTGIATLSTPMERVGWPPGQTG